MLTAVNGAYRENGRITGGTVIADKECADCWKQGVHSPMVTSVKPAT